MNVLFTIWGGTDNDKSPFLNQYVGGVELDVRHLAVAFASRGHRSHFLCMSTTSSDTLVDGVQVHHVSPIFHSRDTQLNFYLQAYCYEKAIRAVCQIHNIQIINPHLVYPCATTVWRAVKNLRVNVIPTISSRDFISLVQERRGTLRAYIAEAIPVLRYRSHIVRSLLEQCSGLITIADHINDDVRQITRHHADISLIPPGIDTRLFDTVGSRSPPPHAKGHDRLDFVFTARFDLPKRHDLLLHALAIANKTNPYAHLHFIGEGPLLKKMKDLANELNLADQVHFHGRIPNQAVAAFLTSMDAFIFACDSEGLPKAVLEALAAGLPIIASNIPPVPRLVKHMVNGYLACNTASDFAAALDLVIKQPEILTQWRKASKLDSMFRSDAMIDSYERLFSETVARTRDVRPAIQGSNGQ